MSHCLVTGANRGIGLELCRQLVTRGDSVIATCRTSTPELEQIDLRVEAGVDVGDDASVQQLADRLSGERLDLLINNAGILERTGLDNLDLECIRRQFEINSLGPLRVTRALRGNLASGAKTAIITSLMGSMTDNTSGSHYGYRMSKAAVNAAGVSLAHDLRRDGIAVAILHPGMVATEMTGHHGIPAAESAGGLITRIDELRLQDSGGFWHANGERLPW